MSIVILVLVANSRGDKEKNEDKDDDNDKDEGKDNGADQENGDDDGRSRGPGGLKMMANARRWLSCWTLLACCVACARDASAPTPPAPPPRAPVSPVASAEHAGSAYEGAAVIGETQATPLEVAAPALAAAPYRGTHKLGVNRVTDMARTGAVTFDLDDGTLTVEGRVARGAHWLALRGLVEPRGAQAFDLVGTIEGVPDMAWAGQPLRQRRTEGRFGFEVRKGRPYFRLYWVNGRECVCQERCGNDFCYVDIEVAEAAP